MKVADAFRQPANFGTRTRSGQFARRITKPQIDRAASFKFETGIERFRSVIKSPSEIRSVKTHDSADRFGSNMPGTAAAIARPGFRIAALLLTALLAYWVGCARRFPTPEVTRIKAVNPAELQQYLLSRKPDVAQFRLRGPFAVIERKDMEIPVISGLTVEANLYLCAAAQKAPLVIVLHGHNNSKEDHAFQAMHLASWGMHSLAIDLPNRGPWIANGRTLAKLVDAIHQNPQLVEGRIDAGKIILVGHSFGATGVAAALGEGAPVVGGVLLDPAGIGRQLPQSLKQITVPVMVIGADEDIRPTRNRGQFFRFIPAKVGEISIRDTLHEDAQYPNEHTLRGFEDDPEDTEEAQVAFVSALTASAFSLAATGSLDYAWNSFENGINNGMFFNARRK
jgi:dienelactone hydrolase